MSSCHKSSFSSGQRGFAADATPSSPEADQINPLLQAPTPGIAGLDGVGKPSDTAQAILRGASISPKKLNRFAAVVRGLHVEDALIQCKTSPQKAAKMCHRVSISMGSAMLGASDMGDTINHDWIHTFSPVD